MDEGKEEKATNASLYYPLFQYMFEAVDVTSYFWQPTLKAIGRTHLEFASLHARQTQALVHWTHQMMRPVTPEEVFNANTLLWATVVQHYVEVGPRVAAVVEKVTEAVASPTVLQMPATRPARDTLILLDRDEAMIPERKVA